MKDDPRPAPKAKATASDEPAITVDEPEGDEARAGERPGDEPAISVEESLGDEARAGERPGDEPAISVDEGANDEAADGAHGEEDADGEPVLMLNHPTTPRAPTVEEIAASIAKLRDQDAAVALKNLMAGTEKKPRKPRTLLRKPDPEKGARRDMILTLVILGASLAYMVGGPLVRRLQAHPSEKECAALLDRYVEHVAYAIDPSPTSSVAAERKTMARAAAKNRSAFTRCETELTRSELECAMQAPSADTFERCLP